MPYLPPARGRARKARRRISRSTRCSTFDAICKQVTPDPPCIRSRQTVGHLALPSAIVATKEWAD
jgi:hypothetical protein